MAAPDTCPNCDAELEPGARACPECGSCAETGWSERATEDRLGIPASDFNYEEFTAREFGEGEPEAARGGGISPLWWLVAAGLVVLFLIAAF